MDEMGLTDSEGEDETLTEYQRAQKELKQSEVSKFTWYISVNDIAKYTNTTYEQSMDRPIFDHLGLVRIKHAQDTYKAEHSRY